VTAVEWLIRCVISGALERQAQQTRRVASRFAPHAEHWDYAMWDSLTEQSAALSAEALAVRYGG
jgi:hypothetical protein